VKNAVSFEHVYRENYERLYTLAFRLTGNRDEAEDVLQTSYANALAGFDDFRGDAAVSTWLYRIVINTAKQSWKQREKLPLPCGRKRAE